MSWRFSPLSAADETMPAMGDIIRVTPDPIDLSSLVQAVARDSCGAIASFMGVVRDHNLGHSVRHIVYQAYSSMALREMEAIAVQIRGRWKIEAMALVHRTGRLVVGDVAVGVVVAAGHRREALESCAFGIETIKRRVPIWKKEFGESGEEWVSGDPSR